MFTLPLKFFRHVKMDFHHCPDPFYQNAIRTKCKRSDITAQSIYQPGSVYGLRYSEQPLDSAGFIK
jgi:hypothetical protein